MAMYVKVEIVMTIDIGKFYLRISLMTLESKLGFHVAILPIFVAYLVVIRRS
ncbi:hypothetical protein VCHA36P166_190049 [Vibrio chagasii]|nr:hypothetical protein VCHA36P166_190049 [Vibrio chagasii]